MIKFNDNSIYVGQIKQLLNSFNLPQCEVYKEGESYLEGQFFIKDNYLYEVKNGKNEFIRFYKKGDFIPNITKNLEIKNNIYDTYTHKYLGEYLRFLRDYTGLNLMSMYNCFTYEIANNLKLQINIKKSLNASLESKSIDNEGIMFDADDKGFNIFMLPVKFGQTYTIGIDSSSKISIASGLYSNELLFSDTMRLFTQDSFMNVAGSRFNKPFIYKVPKLSNLLYAREQEKNLKLFIKIPSSCKSSIVVLEGDYTKGCNLFINENKEQELCDKFFPYSYKDEEGNIKQLGNYDYVSRPQLFSNNFGLKYLLADRLVEYLSNQVITQNDEITNNIKNLQNKLHYTYPTYVGRDDGIWDNQIRNKLYEIIAKEKINSNFYDILSYLDKDVEINIGGIYTPKDK